MSYLEEKVAAPVYKTDNTAVVIHPVDHATPIVRKMLALTSSTSGGLSAGIVCSRIQATEFFYFLVVWICSLHSPLSLVTTESELQTGLPLYLPRCQTH
jgi:hypothetical protein